MHIQNNDITSATSQNYIWHPIANKLYSLNCWYYSVVFKKSCSQLAIFVSFSIWKKYNPCSYSATLVPPTSCTPTKSNLYFANSLAAVVREPDLYMLLTFHVLMSLLHCLVPVPLSHTFSVCSSPTFLELLLSTYFSNVACWKSAHMSRRVR